MSSIEPRLSRFVPARIAGRLAWVGAISTLLGAAQPAVFGQADAYRGLWVGQVTLKYVNEVAVPLDENNVPIAPDPAVPTPTADQAHLRLILHINGAGQASLLKDVAVLNRKAGTSSAVGKGQPVDLGKDPSILTFLGAGLSSESDMALVTDERLYSEYPAQPAFRVATAVFDFGDSKATDAVNEIVEQAAEAAAASVFAQLPGVFTTSAGRKSAEDAAKAAAQTAVNPIVQSADVAAAFSQFLTSSFTATTVNAIADATTPAGATAAAASALAAATALQNGSFYSDSRAVQMVNAVVAAAQASLAAGGDQAARRTVTHNTASAFADIQNQYHRFLAGVIFGDMIAGAADAAAAAAVVSGATATTIREAVNANAKVIAARSEALTVRVSNYNDTRGTGAAELVLDAVINSAASALPAGAGAENAIQQAADLAGREALADDVPRFLVPAVTPTPEYNEFVASAGFKNSPATAAQAAAEAAVSHRVNDALYTAQSIENAARVGADQALRAVYSAAARAIRTELPLTGAFGPGRGDPRFRYDIKSQNLPPLGAAALEGTLHLPASHPTNPFRHRRHPDHTVGFDILRKLRLDFDGSSSDPLVRAGFGVDRITGTYREEVFGLHKPLGPNKDTGLRVEGKFELNRISLIDTVNAR